MSKHLHAVLVLFLLCTPATNAYPEDAPLEYRINYTVVHGGLKVASDRFDENMPRLGIALAGGGAKAAAAAGVLKVLRREGFPVSFIAGTSMGAGVGGMYAAGYSPEEIEKIFLANDWNEIFKDTPNRAFLTQEQKESGSRYLLEVTFRDGMFKLPAGLTAGQKLMNLLASKTLAASFEADLDFNRLPVPFRAVATDIETGNAVVLSHGLLHEAIRASMAIPLAFQPVEIDGKLLVDGGLADNLPVDVVKAMGADVVIAVDSSAKPEKQQNLTSLFEIMSQSISLPIRKESDRQAALADLVIVPDTSAYSFTDFPAIQKIIAQGEAAAQAALPRIRELMKPKQGSKAAPVDLRITSLEIRGANVVSESRLRLAMALALKPRDIRKTLAQVYGVGPFSDVALELRPERTGYHAILTVAENAPVKSISISGNTVIPSGDIMAAVGWQIDQPLDNTRLAGSLDRIVKRYRDQGYLLGRVERTELKPDGTLELAFYEGRVDSITLAGHAITSRYLIRRETRTRVGYPLNFEMAAHDVQRLYALDYFESIGVDMKKSPQGGVDITIKIKEKPANRIRLGLRYDLEDSFTGLTDIVLDNVGGRGVKVFLNTRYGNYTDIALGYRSPVVLRTYFQHTVDYLYQKRDYFIYQDKHKIKELEIIRAGGEFSFGYQWFRFGDTYLRYRYATDKTDEIFGMNPPKHTEHVGSLALLSTMDNRDTNDFPHSGVLFKGSYEAARPEYGSTNAFTKTTGSLQGNVPLAEHHTLVLEGSLGVGSGVIPYVDQYGIGGADYVLGIPLFGYQRREFTGNDEMGFGIAWRWKVRDYQLNAVKAVYLNVAAQAANVWDRRRDISVTDLRNGAGVGLHADTLIGPMRLDFGVGEQRRYDVYFSAGFDF
ncbi:MAG TPA: patatin-like phospholipase family protein [Nitrospirota bacterium]|nr:patatin-like phospholipase family protein [Nitrospirota bacterium]